MTKKTYEIESILKEIKDLKAKDENARQQQILDRFSCLSDLIDRTSRLEMKFDSYELDMDGISKCGIQLSNDGQTLKIDGKGIHRLSGRWYNFKQWLKRFFAVEK